MPNLLKKTKNLRTQEFLPSNTKQLLTTLHTYCPLATLLKYTSVPSHSMSQGYGNGHVATKLFITGLQLIIGIKSSIEV